MNLEVLALIEVYECKQGSTEKKLLDKFIVRYPAKRFPAPKDFAECLERNGKKATAEKGIKGRITVEMPNGSPEMYRLRRAGTIINRVFNINLFTE